MAKKVEKTAPKKRTPDGTVRGKNVYDRIEKVGSNNEIGGAVPIRMLGKGVSAV
jgi:hypothetical protein